MIFLHRRHSIQPFTKGLPSGQILDFLTSVLEPDEGAAAAVTCQLISKRACVSLLAQEGRAGALQWPLLPSQVSGGHEREPQSAAHVQVLSTGSM